jgi:biopolymer transport protein ExbB
MYLLLESIQDVRLFLERGGEVLIPILLLILGMWILIIERAVYFRFGFPRLAAHLRARWEARAERQSWQAHQVRKALVTESSMSLFRGLDVIKTLIAICPLLGLLGTVTGMMEVFDVMAFVGNGNVRAMAEGISKATIPTMSGMVGALTGVFFIALLERRAKLQQTHFEDALTFDH